MANDEDGKHLAAMKEGRDGEAFLPELFFVLFFNCYMSI